MNNRVDPKNIGALLGESHFVERLDSFAVDSIAGPYGRDQRENRRIRVDWYET